MDYPQVGKSDERGVYIVTFIGSATFSGDRLAGENVTREEGMFLLQE